MGLLPILSGILACGKWFRGQWHICIPRCGFLQSENIIYSFHIPISERLPWRIWNLLFDTHEIVLQEERCSCRNDRQGRMFSILKQLNSEGSSSNARGNSTYYPTFTNATTRMNSSDQLEICLPDRLITGIIYSELQLILPRDYMFRSIGGHA